MKFHNRGLWEFFEVHLMVVLMIIFMINIFLQIFCRVFLNQPLFFSEELSRYAFLWMVFLGLSFATLHKRHIRLGLIVEKLPLNAQRVIDIMLHLLAIVCFTWIGFTSIFWLRFIGNSVTNALRIPRWIIGLILPISSCLVIIRSFQMIIQDITLMKAGKEEKKEGKQ